MGISKRLFDLHVHSVRSDGADSPMQLADLARRSGLAGIALTDHDTLVNAEVERIFAFMGVTLITGVELSCELNGQGFHLLGLGYDAQNRPLQAICSQLQASRRERWGRMLGDLRQRRLPIDYHRMEQLADVATPCRSHLARELVRVRLCSSQQAAFNRYLGTSETETTAFSRIKLTDAVQAIHAAGGIAVLAHPPARLKFDVWQAIVATKLDGLETSFPGVAKSHQTFLREIAQQHGLRETAGSDYHGGASGRFLGSHTVTALEVDDLISRAPTL